MTDSRPRILLNERVSRELDISSYLDVYHDRGGRLSIDDVRAGKVHFQPNANNGIQTGLGSNVYWIRGTISSSLSAPAEAGEWLLLVQNPQVLDAQLFTPSQPDLDSSLIGLAHPDIQEPFSDRNPVFPLTLSDSAPLQFYLRIRTDGVSNIPIKIWNRDSYLVSKRSSLPGWGLMFGALAALVLYNLFIYLSLRETAYLRLSGFLLALLVETLVREGYMALYLTHTLPWLNVRLEYCTRLLALATAILFTRDFLAIGRYFPRLDKVLRLSQYLALGMAVTNLLFNPGSLVMEPAFAGISAVFAVSSVLASMHGGDRGTRYYLAGWSFLLLTFLIFELSQYGVLPVNALTQRGQDIAVCVLGLALSLGLAAQIRRARFEKQRALLRQQETMLELKYSEDQIQKKVLRDTLREFPARDGLEEVLDSVLQSGSDLPLVLVLMDLHHVNQVEKQMGHAARDELLTRATRRLSVILHSVSGVLPLEEVSHRYIPMAVLSDGCYGFILRGMFNDSINTAILEVEQAMLRPFFYQGVALRPGISFGLARAGEHGDTAGELMSHAFASLAADRNKNLAKPWNFGRVDQYNARNIVLINELRSAIQEDQISLYFQPIYDLRRNFVCGLEVFSRWDSLTGHPISPSEIFYLAEVGGFVSELTLKMMEKALRYFVMATGTPDSTLKLSINLSPKCLREDHFMDEVALLLAKYRLPPQRLALEIKEAAIIEDPSITREVLNRIRNLGVGLTIDDFGTAYSNPSYLSSLPVTEVKLDQSLVARLDEGDMTDMIQTLIVLCREQNIKLVVHGVEDESTLTRLEQMGCSFAQGRYLAAPVLARDFKLPRNRFSPPAFQQA